MQSGGERICSLGVCDDVADFLLAAKGGLVDVLCLHNSLLADCAMDRRSVRSVSRGGASGFVGRGLSIVFRFAGWEFRYTCPDGFRTDGMVSKSRVEIGGRTLLECCDD